MNLNYLFLLLPDSWFLFFSLYTNSHVNIVFSFRHRKNKCNLETTKNIKGNNKTWMLLLNRCVCLLHKKKLFFLLFRAIRIIMGFPLDKCQFLHTNIWLCENIYVLFHYIHSICTKEESMDLHNTITHRWQSFAMTDEFDVDEIWI